MAVAGEGRPEIERFLGGHVTTAHSHRWVGFAIIGAGLVLLLSRPRSVARFLTESVRFRRADLSWFAGYPRFIARPSRSPPSRHEGHFDPGQRVFNCLVVLTLLALAVTGVLMSFPQRVTPGAFRLSIRIHRAATWALGLSVAGHVLVASGLLPAYRGVWRAMHKQGTVATVLAKRLWPRWAEEARQRTKLR